MILGGLGCPRGSLGSTWGVPWESWEPWGGPGGLWGALGVVLAWVLGFFGVIFGKAKRLFSEAKR